MTDQQTTSTGLPLVQGNVSSPQFLYVPIPDGTDWYKAEAKTVGGTEANGWKTTKINYWKAPDRRIEGQESPHNHPWNFTADILEGAYTEQRYWLAANGQVKSEVVTHKEGDTNEVDIDVYHEVIDVVPGTLTLMKCIGEPGSWGYLDVNTGETWANGDDTKSTFNPDMFANMRALNPAHPMFIS